MTPEQEQELLKRIISIDILVSTLTIIAVVAASIGAAVWVYRLAIDLSPKEDWWALVSLGVAFATFYLILHALHVYVQRAAARSSISN